MKISQKNLRVNSQSVNICTYLIMKKGKKKKKTHKRNSNNKQLTGTIHEYFIKNPIAFLKQ